MTQEKTNKLLEALQLINMEQGEALEILQGENSQILLEETPGLKLYKCSCCWITHKQYKVYFTSLHLSILIKIFKWAVQKRQNEFLKSDLKNVLNHTDYGNLYTLQRFWLIYFIKDPETWRNIKGSWGINLKRAYDFLNWKFEIAQFYRRNTATKQNISSRKEGFLVNVYQIKRINYKPELFNLDKYFVEYKNFTLV